MWTLFKSVNQQNAVEKVLTLQHLPLRNTNHSYQSYAKFVSIGCCFNSMETLSLVKGGQVSTSQHIIPFLFFVKKKEKTNHNELNRLPALNAIYSQHRNNSLIQCGLLQILCLGQSYLEMCSAVMFKYVYKWKQSALSSFIEINWIMRHIYGCHFFFNCQCIGLYSKPMAFSYRDSQRTMPELRSSHAFMMKSIWLLFVPERFYYFAQVGEQTTCLIETRCHPLPSVSIEEQLPWKYCSSYRFTVEHSCVWFIDKTLTDNERKKWHESPHGMNTNAKHFLFSKKRLINSTVLWI